jgi:hypothetical protein
VAQLDGLLQLMLIECPPPVAADTSSIRQCCYAAITETRQSLVGSAEADPCLSRVVK